MKTIRITAANADEKIKQLYETAFPEDEQIPWDDLMRLVGEMPLDFTAYYDGEVMEQQEHNQACLNFAESRQNSTESQDFIGFTIVYPRKSFNWLWYFAVSKELRGKGYGQQILTKLIERYEDQPFVLDMESTTQVCDNLEQRKQRRTFYLRNGFKDTNVYRTYNDITMTIMMRGEGTFTMQDWDDIIHELQQFWWPDDVKEK
ncbi:MAG: GNAT family N-acetyltransferase [Bacteroidaceae bacterium]|nr:GNAT family N-acetyltransferase [Bacteroidaceae bacterium]